MACGLGAIPQAHHCALGHMAPLVPVSSSLTFGTLHVLLRSFLVLGVVAGTLMDIYSMMRCLKKQPWAPLSNLSKRCHSKTALEVSIVREALRLGTAPRWRRVASPLHPPPSFISLFWCWGQNQDLRQLGPGTAIGLHPSPFFT